MGESRNRFGTLQRFVEWAKQSVLLLWGHVRTSVRGSADVLINVDVSSEGRCELE